MHGVTTAMISGVVLSHIVNCHCAKANISDIRFFVAVSYINKYLANMYCIRFCEPHRQSKCTTDCFLLKNLFGQNKMERQSELFSHMFQGMLVLAKQSPGEFHSSLHALGRAHIGFEICGERV